MISRSPSPTRRTGRSVPHSAVLLMLVVGMLVLFVLRRFDLDAVLGRR